MLFHVTHVHKEELCPAHRPEKARATFGKILSSAEQIVVTLVRAWVDGPAHAVYLVVETDSVEKLSDLFYPALSIAHADVRPVEDALALLNRRFAES